MYFCAIDIYAWMCIILVFLVDKDSPCIYSAYLGISVILTVLEMPQKLRMHILYKEFRFLEILGGLFYTYLDLLLGSDEVSV
jgi:hypothetical protein